MKNAVLFVFTLSLVFSFSNQAFAQLRIVTYNTNTFVPGSGDSARFAQPAVDTVIQAIAEESVNGIARAPDIILLQEQQRPSTTTANLAQRLNAIFGAGTYAAGEESAFTSVTSGTGPLTAGEIRQSVLYRTDSVELISEDSFGFVSGPVQPRETLLHQFRPVGYDSSADLFVFNAHFEAGDDAGDLTGRFTEAVNIRERADSLGAGANVIVAGDLNVDSSNEASFQRLIADVGTVIEDDVFTGEVGGPPPFSTTVDRVLGSGQVFDPAGRLGDFSNNEDFADLHTQSPCQGSDCFETFVSGGVDDRFDFILTSEELLDDDGVAFIADSYRVFGNNGSTFNSAINDENTIQFEGITSFTDEEVLDALFAASDHLPVVTDFQLPAVLEAILTDVIPLTVTQGEEVDLEVAIRNAAAVSVVIGADELDFELTTSGAVSGSFEGVDEALGDGLLTQVSLDTSILGLQEGLITVTSSSTGVANGEIFIPVSFTVVAVPEPNSLLLATISLIGATMVRRRNRFYQ